VPCWLDGFYSYSVFRSLSIIGLFQVNRNILAPKMKALYAGCKNKIAISLKIADMIWSTF
jgi:hypothetical protein